MTVIKNKTSEYMLVECCLNSTNQHVQRPSPTSEQFQTFEKVIPLKQVLSEGNYLPGTLFRSWLLRWEDNHLTAWWMKLSFSKFVLAWRLLSLLPDGSRLKKLCVGWVGSPAMLRTLRVRRVL